MKRLCIVSLGLSMLITNCWAIPSAITYQGTLKEKGIPAQGPKDMTFQLTDPSGNVPYSNGISKTVTVSNGLFSASLSFQLLPAYSWDTISPYLKVTIGG